MKKIKNLNKGFTLIELLVVVAIIGILASVVLASLNNARDKGGSAAIKSNLAGARNQAELLFDTHSVYGPNATPVAFPLAQCANTTDTLFSDSTIWNQITAAFNAGMGVTGTRCYASTTAWAAAVQLKGGGLAGDTTQDSWCVDSTGASRAYAWTTGQSINDSINGTVCP